MSDSTPGRATAGGFPETALERRGLRLATGAPVTGAVTTSKAVAAGFGDGTLRLFSGDDEPTVVQSHRGVVLCLAADGEHVLSGGDDGRFVRSAPDGTVEELMDFGSRWVDCVAANHSLRACSSGRKAYLWHSSQAEPTVLEHDSTVGGLAFDRAGEQLAVAHYGGATVWRRQNERWTSLNLDWKGSHGLVCFSPDGRFLVTAMQENAIHGWRLSDQGQMEMAGYPGKVKSLAWAGSTPYLVTSGADEAICWPFDGKQGPLGRAPLCVAHGGDQLATCVQSLVALDALLVGYQDGAVLFAELDEAKEAAVVRGSNGKEVTAMAVHPSLSHLLIGDAGGNILWTRIGAA